MRYTNRLGLPEQFVKAASVDRHPMREKTYSVTGILKGVCESVLTRRHSDELSTDVAENVWAIFGSAVHSIFESVDETESQIKEGFVYLDMPNGYRLTGIFDLYDADRGVVTDWKTASVWKAIYNDWDDYRRQVLCYAVILDSMGFDVSGGEIVALLKDHSKTQASRDREYPQLPLVKVSWDFSRTEIDEMRDWIESRFRDIEGAELLPDDEIPECTPEERWHKDDMWAVIKEGRKKAVKLWPSEQQAVEHAASLGNGYSVEFRQGDDAKCSNYCPVHEFCHFRKQQHGSR